MSEHFKGRSFNEPVDKAGHPSSNEAHFPTVFGTAGLDKLQLMFLPCMAFERRVALTVDTYRCGVLPNFP